MPAGADRVLHFLAPCLAVIPSVTSPSAVGTCCDGDAINLQARS